MDVSTPFILPILSRYVLRVAVQQIAYAACQSQIVAVMPVRAIAMEPITPEVPSACLICSQAQRWSLQ